MGAICLIDTSLFVKNINVPQKATQHQQIIQQLADKIKAKESLFLPSKGVA